MKILDFRSDTVTQPTEAMWQAMKSAPLGDDVFGDDPTVNKLQKITADLFGMEESLFCPSGTMTNQIAIGLHTEQRFSEVIIEKSNHVYQYEVGGIAHHARANVNTICGDAGRLTRELIEENLVGPDVHKTDVSVVSLENTTNRGGGLCYDFNEIERIKELCLEKKFKLHLDGARLFHAIVAKKEEPQAYGKIFDTISICLSKGLGCPVGSLLLGSKKNIERARKYRKSFGGGMRQAGILAAAGIFALENNIPRLDRDHQVARDLAKILTEHPMAIEPMPFETNIVIMKVQDENTFVEEMAKNNILCCAFGKGLVRFVVHLGLDDEVNRNVEDRLLRS